MLAPWESALLAGMVASPTAFDPVLHPGAAKARRNLVLQNMYQQGYISRQQYFMGVNKPLPTAADIQQPSEPTVAPYFTSWLRPQILAAMGLGHGVPASVAEYRTYFGGLKIRTTLDLKLQQAAEQAISAELPTGYHLPSASLVAIDNKTGEVRAMVGGPIVNGQEDYEHHPFNLATEGHRQPGSAFKPFTLAVALESGYGPSSLMTSAPADFIVPHSGGKEHFPVRNFGNTYSGTITLANATAFSDNSVYARLGIQGLGKNGTTRIARMATRMGIRSPVSNNYAMILGGLREGVTPLDMAHAYETFAEGGRKVFNPKLGAPDEGPTGIAQINCPNCRHKTIVDKPDYKRILPPEVAATVQQILTGPVRFGTATAAALSGVVVAGKTGTTSNYGDAWFVGWTPQMTTAVWVGYPNGLVSMANDFRGGPVEGGTYPAIIWHNFMAQALQILASESPAKKSPNGTTTTGTTGSTLTPVGPVVRLDLGDHDAQCDDPGRAAVAAPPEPATAPARPGRVTAARAARRAVAAVEPRAAAVARPVAAAEPRAAAVAPPVVAAARPAVAVAPAAVPVVAARAAPGSAAAAARLLPASARDRTRVLAHRPRQEAAARRAEAPRQLGCLGDPDALVDDDLDVSPRPRPRREHDRPDREVAAVVLELDVERLGELPGTRAQALEALQATPLAHQLDPLQRLERPDQHPGADPFGLADGVQQRVDPVGAIHVRPARRTEQGRCARCEAHERVARRLRVVVGLGLDDHARRACVRDHAADQVAGDLEHRPRVERGLHPDLASSRAGPVQLLSHAVEAGAALGNLRLEPRAVARAPHRTRGPAAATARRARPRSAATGTCPAAPPSGPGPRPRRGPGETEPRGAPAGLPRRSLPGIRRSPPAPAARGRNAIEPSMPLAASRHSASVSAASNRGSLSSCMSLL